MKTLILTLAAAASLSAAGAAVAQPGYGYGYHDDDRRSGDVQQRVDGRIANLQRRIDEGIASGQLNRREAWRARSALRNITLTERHYLRDGYINNYERADLDRRFDMLSQQIRYDRHDGDGYRDREHPRYGYNTYRPY